MGGGGPQAQSRGHRKGKDLMDERRMEGGRQAWRKERQGGRGKKKRERRGGREGGRKGGREEETEAKRGRKE